MVSKKLQFTTLLLFGCIFLSLPLYNWHAIQRVAKADTNTKNITIYDDQLKSSFMNWSWNSQINLSQTTPIYQGTDSISFSPSAWGGLYFHTDTAIDISNYGSLAFYLRSDVSSVPLTIIGYDQNNQSNTTALPLGKYVPAPIAGQWNHYTIPLTDIFPTTTQIKGLAIQNASPNTLSPLYIDMVEILAKQNSVQNGSNPLSNAQFFNDSDNNPALTQSNQWSSSRPADAVTIKKIADQPKAIWISSWSGDVHTTVQTVVNKANQTNTMPVFIAYNIPNRDCGSYSAGGLNSNQAYEDWITNFASGIGSNHATIILEPDALAQYTCLPQQGQQDRLMLLQYATQKFKSLGNTHVYIDAGHAGWINPNDMALRLKQAGIDTADGFAINVSNFDTTTTSIQYGQQISTQLSGKHFVIDTSRNGTGPSPDNAWCNPSGRALGEKPTTQTNNQTIDAYLWLKYPGESDGNCNGGPTAGTWYPEYALGLAQRAAW